MTSLLKVIKEQTLSEASGKINHEAEFWKHINTHLKYFEKSMDSSGPWMPKVLTKINQTHLELAHLHAQAHYHQTGSKLRVGDGIGGFESKYVVHE